MVSSNRLAPREGTIRDEIELKLGIPEESLTKLREALSERAGKEPVSAELVSTYYDSPDRALKRSGLTLRVREQDGHFIQTVKSDRGDAIRRGEWEEEIDSWAPDLRAKHTGRRLPREVRHRPLQPLFTTEITRTQVDLKPQRATRIEAAIDKGQIRATVGGRAEPVHELELELKQGKTAEIYDLALQLYDIAALEIGTASKSERGYDLVAGRAPPTPRRQTPIALLPNCSAEVALQAIGRSCLTHLLSNVPAALADQAEGIHQMRVAARRLRSLLSAAKKLLPDGQRRWASAELRWLADVLGSARNWDSLADSLLPEARAGLSHPETLALLSLAAGQRRTMAYDEAKQAIRSRRYGQSVLRLLRWFEACGWRDDVSGKQARWLRMPARGVAADLLDRCMKQVRRRSRHFAAMSPAERHKLRIAVKKLRYDVAFFASLYPKRKTVRFVACLKPLQDALGHANDVRVAHELLADLPRPNGRDAAVVEHSVGLLLGWHERVAREAEPSIAAALQRARDAAPFWR